MSKQTNTHRRHHTQRRIAPGSSLHHRTAAVAAPAAVAAAPTVSQKASQPTPIPSQPTLAELRSRAEAALHERTRPLPQRMAEFRRLLCESRLCSAGSDSTFHLLDDSF